MANKNLKFYKGSLAPDGITTGSIWFDTKNNIIKVKTDNDYDSFGGVVDATLIKSVLTILKADGSSVSLDFSDVASAKATMDVFTKLETLISNKVDKVSGKELSTNDFTDKLKSKLDGIEAGAQVNKIEVVKVNGSPAAVSPKDKSINITIPAATVTGVKAGDKVLKLEGTELTSTIGLVYESASKKINLTGIGNSVIASVDATAFIKDGMVDTVSFNPETKILTITFNTESGKEAIPVDLTSLVDTYTQGNGVEISGNVISIKRDPGSEGFLTVGTSGLKLTGVQGAIDSAKASAIKTASNDAASKVSAVKTTIDNYTVNGIKISTNPVLSGASVSLSKGYTIAKEYKAPVAEDTVDVAIGKLALGVQTASTSGVISFGGKTGAITVKGGGTSNGDVNLTMNNNELRAATVGLKSAAFTESSAYATAAQGSKADSALQKGSIASGSANGTISVGGTNIAVKGLRTAAYTDSNSYDAKGSAENALSSAKAYAETLMSWTEFN